MESKRGRLLKRKNRTQAVLMCVTECKVYLKRDFVNNIRLHLVKSKGRLYYVYIWLILNMQSLSSIRGKCHNIVH